MADSTDTMSLSNRPSHDVVLLYAHPSMHKLARRIAECCHLVSRSSSYSCTPSSSSLQSSSSSSSSNLETDEGIVKETLGLEPQSADSSPSDQPNHKKNKKIKFCIELPAESVTEYAASKTTEASLDANSTDLHPRHSVIPDITGYDEVESSTSGKSPISSNIKSSVSQEVTDIEPTTSTDSARRLSGYKDANHIAPDTTNLKKKPDDDVFTQSKNNSASANTRQDNTTTHEHLVDPRPARRVEFRDTIKWNKFADGYPNLFIEDVKYMAGKDVIFIGSFHSTEIIFEQLSVLYAFPRYLARSFHFILPYFPTGTMERVDTEGQIATAKTLATLLSSIPLCAQGPAQIIIYDIHALQERFYFSDNVIPRLETAIPLLQRVLNSHPQKDKLALAFPDDGAYKRFHSYFPEDDRLIVCAKKRVEGNKRIVTIKDGHPKGKHVVIIDDLVQSGGTLIECAKVLVKQGAKSVSAYVTHPVFPNQSWKSFINCDPPFANFWITNSIPHAEEICKNKPFRLLSLSDIITENLLGFDLRPY
ncbi:ribose phosphate diphosphokinase subunit prs4 [Bulinus truncatus]|nr:ribose phosphate diphosphokinase subunit prs4 [Bulinus truncatus]